MGTQFLQAIFNDISLEKDQALWLSNDDSRLDDRLNLLAQFPQSTFKQHLSENAPVVKMCRKNSKISGALREKGNLSYAQGDLDAALQFYNQALQFADTGEDLSTALANRSAVWTDKKRWSLAVRDIDLALDNNYPEGLKYKVLERKATCLFLKGGQDNVEEGKRCVANAIEALKSSKLTDGKRKAKEGQLENLKDTLKPERGNENEKSLVFDLPKLKDTHEQFPSFSSSVAVRYEEGRGRFCVAAKKIEIGELIAVETPFVAMLDRSEVRSLCWHCFRALLSPLPCRKCSGVLFCGPQCLSEAEGTYHPYECGISDLQHQANLGAWTLAYRAVTSKPASYFLDRQDQFMRHDELAGSDQRNVNVYDSSDIETFHNLVTHDGAGNKEAAELMMQALSAMFFLRCLEFVGYLPAEGGKGELTKEQLFFSKLLHHFMRCTYFNTHETTVADENSGEDSVGLDVAEVSVRRIGRATNPTLSLINHSCDPNYRRINFGRCTLAFATRTIPEGDEISDTYCQIFAAEDAGVRQRALKKYNFVCRCDACAQGWPTLAKLSQKLTGLPQEQCKISDEGEAKRQAKKIATCESIVAKYIRDGANRETVLKAQIRYISELEKLVRPPHYKLSIGEGKLYQMLLALHATRTTHYSI